MVSHCQPSNRPAARIFPAALPIMEKPEITVLSGRTMFKAERLFEPDRETALQISLQLIRDRYAKQDTALAREAGVGELDKLLEAKAKR